MLENEKGGTRLPWNCKEP